MNKIVDTNDLKVYYHLLLKEDTEILTEVKNNPLPKKILEKISQYKNENDRELRKTGKVILRKILQDIGLNHLSTLEFLKYSDNNKPFFNDPVSVSISHTENMVICAVCRSGKLGIDIEKITVTKYEDYSEYFTINEMEKIKKNGLKIFYEFWTMKEALSKATGEGFLLPFNQLDLSNKEILYKNELFYFKNFKIDNDYIASLCYTKNN